jgi:hypothetical protein
VLVWYQERDEKIPYPSVFFLDTDGAVLDVADLVLLLMMWMPVAGSMINVSNEEYHLVNVTRNLSIVCVQRGTLKLKKVKKLRSCIML